MKPTLIISEDVELIREELCVLLGGDFEILAAVGNGLTAIDAVRRHEPRLLLMDVVMPGISGIEAARAILAGPPPHPQIILFSEVKSDPVVRRALESGAVDFVLKPVQPKRLLKVLREALGK